MLSERGALCRLMLSSSLEIWIYGIFLLFYVFLLFFKNHLYTWHFTMVENNLHFRENCKKTWKIVNPSELVQVLEWIWPSCTQTYIKCSDILLPNANFSITSLTWVFQKVFCGGRHKGGEIRQRSASCSFQANSSKDSLQMETAPSEEQEDSTHQNAARETS